LAQWLMQRVITVTHVTQQMVQTRHTSLANVLDTQSLKFIATVKAGDSPGGLTVVTNAK